MQDAEPPPGAVTDQLPLIPAGDLPEDGEPGNLPDRKRTRGRPPGARNKSTDDWVDYIRARYRSPLEMLAETFSRHVDDLARELGISKKDAFAFQLQAAKELAPYMHSKMPQALTIDGTADITLILEGGAPGLQAGAPGDGAVVIDVESIEENQEVSDAVGQGKSDDDG